MEKKYLRWLGISAIALTVIMAIYLGIAATIGSHIAAAKAAQAAAQSGNSAQQASDPVDAQLFPQQLAGMNKSYAMSGDDAMNSLATLHGTDVQLVSADIVDYANGNSTKMIIWYSVTPDQANAAQLLKEIIAKLAQSTGYTDRKTVVIGGIPMHYDSSSDGYLHYLWQSGNRVIWLDVKAANPKNIVEQVAPLY
ncbi:MAG: hypothetical protein M0Z55_13155 [Peptococcaceae bacterium]|nr:hypothetical protein [Peptococcaceae bacterium]